MPPMDPVCEGLNPIGLSPNCLCVKMKINNVEHLVSRDPNCQCQKKVENAWLAIALGLEKPLKCNVEPWLLGLKCVVEMTPSLLWE